MRSSTRTEESPGYSKHIGRVGALAIFLGVGTSLGMATASADSDGAPASHAASSASAGATSDAAKGPSARGSRPSAHKAVAGVHPSALSSHPTRPAATRAAAASTRRQSVVASIAPSNQVSPLGTPVQLSRERIAMDTAATVPVTLMKFVLRQGFLAAANQQFKLVGGPDAANLQALDNAVDEYALASAFSEQILNPMDPAVVTQVAAPHSWYGLNVGGSRLLYDNPDTIYRFIPVNKTSEYVLTGRLLEGTPADTTFSVLEGTSGKTSSILALADLDVSPDGSFVITVSGEAATPGQKNHLTLTSNSTLIAARNTLGDWVAEEPMELEVHRVSGPRNSLFAQLGGFVLLGSLVNNNPLLTSIVSLIPPLGIAEAPIVRGALTALLMIVRGANQEAKYMALATTDPNGQLRQPNVMTEPASNAEFLANQLQSNGYFQLNSNQALVLTIDKGSAGFFNVPIYNDWTITDDYWNQQTSLNIYQAVPNPDGTYTLVVSPTDPGVANWVSTGGLNQGTISMRFQNVTDPEQDRPTVGSAVVLIDELDTVLPGSTVKVSAEERQAQLAARQFGYNKRYAPYPQP